MASVELMADYGCYPLWLRTDRGLQNIDPARLDISAGLCEELAQWADEYDATLNAQDPANSGFPNEEAENAFYERGDRRAKRLAQEIGQRYRISYFDPRVGRPRLIEDIE